jgi:phosphatidylinositol alpha-1,6-mannosyltransferase
MRLLLCSMTVPWPDRPSQGAYHVSQARAVNELGHAMEIFSPAPAIPESLGRWFAGCRRHLARPSMYEVDGVPIFSPQVPFVFPRFLRARGAMSAPRLTNGLSMVTADTLRNHCRTRGIEGIVAHGVFPWGLVGTHVACELGIPLCFIEHSAEDVLRLRAGSAITRHYRQMGRRARSVFVVGRPMCDHLMNLMPEVSVELIPNGVTAPPVGLAKRVSRGSALRVLAACHYYRRKGLEELVTAWPAVATRLPGAVLEVHTNAPPSLRQLVKNSPARESIELAGMLPAQHLRQRMAQADLFALPSNGEAFGLVYAESMSVGTPVLMTADCGLAGVVADRLSPLGYVIHDRSPTAVADALISALADAGELRLRGQRGIDYVARHFTWQANAAALISCFAPASGSGGHASTSQSIHHPWNNHAAATHPMA